MNKVFEKIIERLEENQTIVFHLEGGSQTQVIDIVNAIEIVKQEAEQFGRDTNVGSNGWIPCSERLPKLNKLRMSEDVLVSFKDSNTICVAFYDENNKCWHIHSNCPYFGEVIAWQPLQQPYQPKGE